MINPAGGFWGQARRLEREASGFTLIEMLITASLLVVMLIAVLSITDAAKQRSDADQERSITTASAETGLARMARELRQACAIFVPGWTPSTGLYCFNQFSSAPATTSCTRTTDCVDFVTRAATSFSRSGNSVSSISHPLVRVRYECAAADPSSTTDLPRTRCLRFSASCGASSCPSPTGQNGVLVQAILNSGTTASPPIFRYCTRSDPFTCNVTPSATLTSNNPAAAAMSITVRIARRGLRSSGTSTSMLLQDGVELQNIALDSSPSS